MCAKSSTFAVAFVGMPENVNKTNKNNNQKNSTNMKPLQDECMSRIRNSAKLRLQKIKNLIL